MGKIRVKTFGDEELEQKEKEKVEKRHEAKIGAAKPSAERKTAKAPGMKGGERIVAVGPSEEELAALEQTETAAKAEETQEPKKEPRKTQKPQKKAFHSQKYQALSQLIDKTKIYNLKEALELLQKLQRNTIDETVELHVNTTSTGISGNVTLPNGTGKKTRVAIASDALISEIEKGIINFDILLSEPSMMGKLAKVARVLGPKGLMPNPKNGTITVNPQEALKKYEGGQVNFKTEAKSPIMHLTVGKMLFGKEKLIQNIESLITAVKKSNIVNMTLKSTMSPGIKIKV